MTNNHVLFVSTAEHDEEVQSILEENGLLVTRLNSMHEIRQVEDLDKYRIVLLDLDLPCVNNNAIYRLKNKTRQAWIIGFSSRTYNPHLKESLRSCMFAVLGKPADAEELIYCMHSLLKQAES